MRQSLIKYISLLFGYNHSYEFMKQKPLKLPIARNLPEFYKSNHYPVDDIFVPDALYRLSDLYSLGN